MSINTIVKRDNKDMKETPKIISFFMFIVTPIHFSIIMWSEIYFLIKMCVLHILNRYWFAVKL
ncbi:hypothetical protein EAH57_13440 [Acinetobacter sp. 2JN-4]|nr:hypothetical protein EAH57_13440 [Acinetobacter sp. 2JN-4]